MNNLIKNEFIKVLKSKKNRFLLIALLILLVSVNLYYIGKHNNYMNELEKETTISYNSAQIRISKTISELASFESEEGINKIHLEKKYGSLEKAGENKELLEIEQRRNTKELSYVKAILLQEKQLRFRRGKVIEDEDKIISQVLDYKIKRTDNIIGADKEGVVPESALKLRNITMNDIRRKNVYYNYLKENDIKYTINPYTNTGVFAISKLLENNIILFIFIVFTFISMDLFLSEVEEGSYKLAYTQSYERRRIFLAKIIGITLFVILTLLILISINFLINTIINGTGDFGEPVAVSENINKISLSNENIEFEIISTGKNILLSVALFSVVMFFNITLISFISIFTDSTTKTMGISIILIILYMFFREFLPLDSIIHGVSPFAYIFTEDILIEKYNTSYILGILLNLGLSIILLITGCRKFVNKDFLGSKD